MKTDFGLTDRHGSLSDRGAADSYYRRPPNPHYYIGPSYQSAKVTQLDRKQIQVYLDAYEENERQMNWKDND